MDEELVESKNVKFANLVTINRWPGQVTVLNFGYRTNETNAVEHVTSIAIMEAALLALTDLIKRALEFVPLTKG